MASPLLVKFDPSKDLHQSLLQKVSYLSAIYIESDQVSLASCQDFIQKNCNLIDVYCECTSLSSSAEILSLLDAGCKKVFVVESALQSLAANGLTEDHLNRLVLCLQQIHSDAIPERIESALGLLGVSKGNNLSYMIDYVEVDAISKLEHVPSPIYAMVPDSCSTEAVALLRKGVTAILPANLMEALHAETSTSFSLCDVFTDLLQSDRPDGLYPTVVTDERGICLGMVYSSRESLTKAVQLGQGVYYSRSRRKLWIKGEESGNTQELVKLSVDCDYDAVQVSVRQQGSGFCHLAQRSCFGSSNGIARLEGTLQSRLLSAPKGSYTARLFNDSKLLQAKIMEEASELCEANDPVDIADEAADLIYFALTKCVAAGVSFDQVERSLDRKSTKITRRKGDAKARWVDKAGIAQVNGDGTTGGTTSSQESAPNNKTTPTQHTLSEAQSIPKAKEDPSGIRDGRISLKRYIAADEPHETIKKALQRPSQRTTQDIISVVAPIVEDIKVKGDAALLKYTHKFEKAVTLSSPVLKAPFPEKLMSLSKDTTEAIDISFNNIRKFHAAQADAHPLRIETMPGVVCSRFSRPIERVGLYVPGGTATLPSTAMMLGVPAMVAGCKQIVIASPPRADGSIAPEIVYIASKVGAESIVLAGGAQAVGALAYGTESVTKVDKILGPGNQFVTAAKMMVSNDTTAGVSIDMPAGPSEVLVVADKTANPAFVASDLLSQAEHGVDSQVVLIAVDLDAGALQAIEDEVHEQANALPRVDIVRGAIEHSVTLVVKNIAEAMQYSNEYAPEHLILQVENAHEVVAMVQNAGSVFVGPWTPESVGDYSGGTNHSLPTYGYAKQYSGVNLSSFTKHITCSELTEDGLKNISGAVMELASVEKLEAHRRAVSIRLR